MFTTTANRTPYEGPVVLYFNFSIDQVIIKKFIGSSKENILKINKM